MPRHFVEFFILADDKGGGERLIRDDRRVETSMSKPITFDS